MKTNFEPNTITENTNSLAAYMPNDDLFLAKYIEGSNLRKLLYGIAQEYNLVQNKIYEISVENDLLHTTNLIDEWERALGLPDTCMKTAGVPIAQRRKQIVAKFGKMNLTTEEDWKALATFFGFTIKIEYGSQSDVFTMIFPVYFTGSAKAARFTMIITFMGIAKPSNVFPMKFPFIFEDTNFMICLFNKLKPANVNILYRWEL